MNFVPKPTIVVVTVALSILVAFSATASATTWTVDDNSPAMKNQKQEFSLPEHAVEVSSGVFLSWRING